MSFVVDRRKLLRLVLFIERTVSALDRCPQATVTITVSGGSARAIATPDIAGLPQPVHGLESSNRVERDEISNMELCHLRGLGAFLGEVASRMTDDTRSRRAIHLGETTLVTGVARRIVKVKSPERFRIERMATHGSLGGVRPKFGLLMRKQHLDKEIE